MKKKADKRNDCYLCTTPFQILGAVSIAFNSPRKADIFIFDDFKDYKKICENLSELDVFDNVYCIDFYSTLPERKKRILRLFCFFRMLFPERYLKSVIDKNICYETLYTSSSAVSKMVVANALFRRNKKMQVVMYDDGVGSYSKSERVRTGSVLFQKAKRILRWPDILGNATAILLYQPEMRGSMESGTTVTKQMPYLEQSETNRALLNKIFCRNSQKNTAISENVILFDTYRKVEEHNEKNELLDNLYLKVLKICGYENVILKAHPKSTGISNININKFDDFSVPIEVIYFQQRELEEKILVTFNSTSVFTPKMMFNKEPYIILLYKLVDRNPEVCKKRDELYGNLLKMYKQRDRIFIPTTVEELECVLLTWIEEMGLTKNSM